MTEWFVSLGLNYPLVGLCVSGLLNIIQFAHAHGLTAKLGHLLEHGHAPDGKALVPAEAVVVAASITAPPPKETPLETLTAMAGGTLRKGWHLEPDIQPADPPVLTDVAVAPVVAKADIPAATAADSGNPSKYFWNVGETLGLAGNDLVRFESKCARAVIADGHTDPSTLTRVAAFAAGSL